MTGTKYYEAIDIVMELCWSISKCINPKATEPRFIPKLKFSRPNLTVSTRQPSVAEQRKHDKVENLVKQPASQATLQTEVVDGLDKLVNLHRQGYLSDEEFSLAKTKLLQ